MKGPILVLAKAYDAFAIVWAVFCAVLVHVVPWMLGLRGARGLQVGLAVASVALIAGYQLPRLLGVEQRVLEARRRECFDQTRARIDALLGREHDGSRGEALASARIALERFHRRFPRDQESYEALIHEIQAAERRDR